MQSYPKFQNKILILPSLSYGLCDSLALDLIIYNLKFQKVANLDFRNLYPVVFNLEEISQGITLPCELYEKDKYVILQIRSTIAPGGSKEFMKQLEEFISSSSFEEVVCLSSVNVTIVVRDYLKQTQQKLFFYTNSDEKAKKLSDKSEIITNVQNLFGKYQEDIEKQAIRGISRKIKRSQVLDKLPLTVVYVLMGNTIDIEASAVLAKFLIDSLGLGFSGNLAFPKYFQRLNE